MPSLSMLTTDWLIDRLPEEARPYPLARFAEDV